MGHHHDHHHPTSGQTLRWALLITLGFAIVEAFGGWLSGSLALLGDAGHMLTDASALGLAAFAAWLGQRPPSMRHSYGLVRAEVIAAIINSLFMLLIIVAIVIHALERFQQPQDIDAATVIAIATLGLFINFAVAWVLHRGEQNLNTRGAMLHVIGDLLGSAAALIGGIVIYFSGWTTIDPILSLLICGLILVSSIRLLKEAIHVIMEGVPQNLELPEVATSMAKVEGVCSVHDLHIWNLSSGTTALSAHVVIKEMEQWPTILEQLKALLHDQFDIEHTTIQPEPGLQVTLIPISEISRLHH